MSRSSEPSRSLQIGAALFVAVLAVMAYLTALDNPFVFDDFTEILQNRSIRDLSDLRQIVLLYPTRPLSNLFYAFGFAATGTNPLGYHLISLALHAINALLLFVLTRRLLVRTRPAGVAASAEAEIAGAFAAAGLFAVHPLMTEAVGYASSQSELLYSVLFLTSFLCFDKVLDHGPIRYAIGGVVAFVVALAAKETAAILPALLLVYDLLLVHEDWIAKRRRLAYLHAPLIGFVALLGLVRIWIYLAVEHPSAAPLQLTGALIELHVIFRYLALVFVPWGQTILPSVPDEFSLGNAQVLLSAGVGISAMAIGVGVWYRERLASFGLIWFVLLLVPSAALIILANLGQPMAEHRAYLAAAGGLFVVGAVVRRVWTTPLRGMRAVAVLGSLGTAIAILFTLTLLRHRVWEDPVRLWQEAVTRSPGAWMAHYGLAFSYKQEGRYDEAIDPLRNTLALSPSNATAYLQLADTLVALKRYEAARDTLAEATARVPSNVDLVIALSTVEGRMLGQPAVAMRVCLDGLARGMNDERLRDCVAREGKFGS